MYTSYLIQSNNFKRIINRYTQCQESDMNGIFSVNYLYFFLLNRIFLELFCIKTSKCHFSEETRWKMVKKMRFMLMESGYKVR